MIPQLSFDNIKHVGIVSDTHGLIRPVDLIVHAGDIGDIRVIETLQSIAPVVAVHGNIDTGVCASKFPAKVIVRINHLLFYVLHNIAELEISLAEEGIDCVVCGHSHKPLVLRRDDVFHINPGSCGPRRFNLPVAAARLEFIDETYSCDIKTFAK